MIYHKEVVKIDCTMFGYIVLQDEWTGNAKGRLYTLHLKDNDYYCNAEGRRVPMDEEYRQWKKQNDKIESALDWYNKTKF